MSDLLNGLAQFVGQLQPGMLPLPPYRHALGDSRPNLDGVQRRDNEGIICQVQYPGTKKENLDGGDSAHRTGVTAFCNSNEDVKLLPRFEVPRGSGLMVRHPTQEWWNNPINCSRDQLIGYVAGCWRAGLFPIAERLLVAHQARKPPNTCQNSMTLLKKVKNPPVGDLLRPDDIMYLRICAGTNPAYLDLAAQLSLQLGIESHSKNPKDDIQNLMIRSIVCGRLNLFVKVHPNWQDHIREYWDSRGQNKIGTALIWATGKELTRYPEYNFPLLPTNLFLLLQKLERSGELEKALKSLNPKDHASLAKQFTKAALKDAEYIFVNAMKMGPKVAEKELKKLERAARKSHRLLEKSLNPRNVEDTIREHSPVPLPPKPPIRPPKVPKVKL